jgi:plasmid stability protein
MITNNTGGQMRTTLAIDDDVLAAAKAQAAREHRSLGDVISALARQALQRETPTKRTRNGVPLLPRKAGATPVTMQLVNKLRDELP